MAVEGSECFKPSSLFYVYVWVAYIYLRTSRSPLLHALSQQHGNLH